MDARFSILKLASVVLVSLLLAWACLPDEEYASCEFPAEQEQLCETTTSEEAANNCLVKDHPQCPDGYCISYRNSAPFCSGECVDDSDCPSGGSCKDWALFCKDPMDPKTCLHLCVKNSLLE